jgi:hypothetical protein
MQQIAQKTRQQQYLCITTSRTEAMVHSMDKKPPLGMPGQTWMSAVLKQAESEMIDEASSRFRCRRRVSVRPLRAGEKFVDPRSSCKNHDWRS